MRKKADSLFVALYMTIPSFDQGQEGNEPSPVNPLITVWRFALVPSGAWASMRSERGVRSDGNKYVRLSTLLGMIQGHYILH